MAGGICKFENTIPAIPDTNSKNGVFREDRKLNNLLMILSFINNQAIPQKKIITKVNQILKTIIPYEINPVTSKTKDRTNITNMDNAMKRKYRLYIVVPFKSSQKLPVGKLLG
jgi:hypothetical protein